jgi:hypothetical protein
MHQHGDMNQFHTVDPQTVETTVQNLFAKATFHLGFVCLWSDDGKVVLLQSVRHQTF